MAKWHSWFPPYSKTAISHIPASKRWQSTCPLHSSLPWNPTNFHSLPSSPQYLPICTSLPSKQMPIFVDLPRKYWHTIVNFNWETQFMFLCWGREDYPSGGKFWYWWRYDWYFGPILSQAIRWTLPRWVLSAAVPIDVFHPIMHLSISFRVFHLYYCPPLRLTPSCHSPESCENISRFVVLQYREE